MSNRSSNRPRGKWSFMQNQRWPTGICRLTSEGMSYRVAYPELGVTVSHVARARPSPPSSVILYRLTASALPLLLLL